MERRNKKLQNKAVINKEQKKRETENATDYKKNCINIRHGTGIEDRMKASWPSKKKKYIHTSHSPHI